MGGHQPDRLGAHGPHGEGVGGDVLGLQLGEQVEGAAVAGDLLLGAGGGLEERADGVEVPVGVAAGAAAAQGGAFQAFAPAAGALPQLPEGVLGGAAAGEGLADLAQQAAEGVRAAGIGGVQDGEALGFGEGLAEQLAGRAGDGGGRDGGGGNGGRGIALAVVLGGRGAGPLGVPGPLGGLGAQRGAFLLAQGAAEAAQVGAVQAAERTGEQGVCEFGGERVGRGAPGVPGAPGVLGVLGVLQVVPAVADGLLGADPQRQQQLGDGRLLAQRQVVAVDLQRHPGRSERPPHPGDGPGAGPDQHRHLAPRHAVLQMRPAQQVGDRVQLGAGGRVGADLDPAALPGGQRGAVLGELVAGQPAHRHPPGEFAGGGEQHGTRAAGHPQHLDLGGAAVRVPEGLRELQDAVDVGAPERVDGLVRVPDGDQLAPAAGQPPQQPDLGRVGVLVLVDEDRVVALAQAPLDLRALGEQHRAVHQLGVVEDAAQVEDVEVVGEEVRGGGPVGAPHALGEAGQLVLAQPELAAAGEHGADLVGEAAGGQAGAQVERPGDPGAAAPGVLGAAGEQLADHDVLLGA